MATSSGHDEGEFGSKPFLKKHREMLRNQFASAARKLDEAVSALDAAETSGNACDILCARKTCRLASEHEEWQEDLQKALDHDHVIFVKDSATQLTKEQIGWNLELIQEETHDARRATVAAWPPWEQSGQSDDAWEHGCCGHEYARKTPPQAASAQATPGTRPYSSYSASDFKNLRSLQLLGHKGVASASGSGNTSAATASQSGPADGRERGETTPAARTPASSDADARSRCASIEPLSQQQEGRQAAPQGGDRETPAASAPSSAVPAVPRRAQARHCPVCRDELSILNVAFCYVCWDIYCNICCVEWDCCECAGQPGVRRRH